MPEKALVAHVKAGVRYSLVVATGAYFLALVDVTRISHEPWWWALVTAGVAFVGCPLTGLTGPYAGWRLKGE